MPEDQRMIGWLASRRELKRLKRERTGTSPEKEAEHHAPKGDAVDFMLRHGGVVRESRFKK